MRRRLLALVAAALSLAPAAAADPVAVRGGVEGGRASIVFSWPAPVRYTAERIGDRLIVRFARPIEADLSGLAGSLPAHVAAARIDGDRRTAIIDLARPLAMRTTVDGSTLVVDLIDPALAASAAPAAPSATPGAAPAAAPPLDVRYGAHEGFDRLVFDWRAPVTYRVDQQNGRAVVAFDRPAALDEATLRRRLPPAYGAVSVEPREQGVAVLLPVPDGARLRHFRSGTKVVLDVIGGRPSAAAGSGQQQAAPAAPAAPRGAAPAGGQAATATPGRVAPSAPSAAAPPSSPGARSSAQPGAAPPAATAGDPARAAAQLTGQRPAPVATGAANLIRSSQFQTVPIDQLKGGDLAVVPARNNDALSLRFDWKEEVPAAVFRRAGHLWVVFDRPVRFDLNQLSAGDRQIVGQPEQVPTSSGAALRMPLVAGINPRVWRDGTSWIVDLLPQAQRPDVALAVDVQMVSPQGPRIFLPGEGSGRPIGFRDPEVGDDLLAIPLSPLGRGIDGDRRFAQFELPGTAQGIVVKPLIDDIAVRILPDGLAITTEGGLQLSKATPQSSARATTRGGAFDGLQPGRVFNLVAWRRGERSEFRPQKQELQHQIAESTSISRSAPRLDLARFYFAHGLAAETIGLLKASIAGDQELLGRPEVKALMGAAQFMLGRHDEAAELIGDRTLNGFAEIELWRGAIAAARGDWGAAGEHFARAGEIPGDYPRNYTTELALVAAEAVIRVGDFRGAGAFLDVVAEGRPSEGERSRIAYLRGRVLYAAGDVDTALEFWRSLAEGKDRWSRVRAERALVEHALKTGKITRHEAIERLEALRFTWRGDQLEFDLLRELGELYLAEREYKNGLEALRQATTYFPNSRQAPEVAARMTDAFAGIYTGGPAEAMPPLTALALYEEFKELTPVGERGNEIIQRLADRLVQVDLLDRASKLLERQVKFRLQGVDKARVGARLALIRLLDRKPDEAIVALDESVAPGLPEGLVRERRRLRARALFETGDAAGALALLEGDTTRDADLLRADIYWRSQRWAEAAPVFGRLVGQAGLDGKRISDAMGRFILNWAVTLSLSQDVGKLTEIRQRFASEMDNSPYREAFRLITNNISGSLTDFLKLTERFEEIGRFQAFLTAYREKLRDQPLSATN